MAQTARTAAIQIHASATWDRAERALRLRFHLSADAATRLIIPPASAAPGPRDGLWRHTCFEAFVSDDETRAYREFNFAPSGDWAAYAFADTRVRDATHEAREPLPAPHVTWTRGVHSLLLDARIGMAALPSLPARVGAKLRIGLTAVLEHENHARTTGITQTTQTPPITSMPPMTPPTVLTYWALSHPRPAPDFHDRAGWTLLIPAP